MSNSLGVLFMKKLLAIVPALALGLALGVANADEAKGKIKEVGKDMTSFTLADGTKFSVAKGVSMEGLKAGTEVTVTYETKDGKKVATGVAKAQ